MTARSPPIRPLSKGSRTLLIDGDVLCYQIALSAETAINWADEGQEELWTVSADADETKARFKAAIYALKKNLLADWAIIAITKDTENFRKEILPQYKENRGGQRKPLLLSLLRQYCIDHFGALWHPMLEADDILGILQTGGQFDTTSVNLQTTETVIVSADKDLRTIPGLHYNPGKEREGIVEVSPEDAANFHLIQSLAGDVTDNYPGCPGIGMARARKIVEGGLMVVPYEHVFKSGPRKGEQETRWREVKAGPEVDNKVRLLSYYTKAGLGVEELRANARCAYILHECHWDNNNEVVRPWLV